MTAAIHPRHAEFYRRLHALMVEFNVQISAKDEYKGYAECGEDIRITVELSSYNADGEYIGSGDIETAGSWLDADTLARLLLARGLDVTP